MCDDPNSISFSFWTTSIYSTSSKDIAFISEQISALVFQYTMLLEEQTLYFSAKYYNTIWILYYNTNNVSMQF